MNSVRLKVSEVAKILGVSPATVHRLLERGHFPGAYKIDPTRKSQIIIPKEDVDAFQRKQQGQETSVN